MADEKKTPAAAATATSEKEKITEQVVSPRINYSTMPSHCQVLTITRQEYDMLQNKAIRYDLLRAVALRNGYLTETEKAIYGIFDREDSRD